MKREPKPTVFYSYQLLPCSTEKDDLQTGISQYLMSNID